MRSNGACRSYPGCTFPLPLELRAHLPKILGLSYYAGGKVRSKHHRSHSMTVLGKRGDKSSELTINSQHLARVLIQVQPPQTVNYELARCTCLNPRKVERKYQLREIVGFLGAEAHQAPPSSLPHADYGLGGRRDNHESVPLRLESQFASSHK
jgi:hypothetical protein